MTSYRTALLSAVAALAATAAAAPALAQGRGPGVIVEARAGVNVPTFDIADVADAGPSVGVTVGARVAPRVTVFADADFGFHNGKELGAGVTGPDVNVYHYIAKIGLDAVDPSRGPWTIRLNAGAGAMTFDVDGGTSNTYPAINVGARIAYAVTPAVNLFLSPQGDIAFSNEDELGTNNAWVWPFSGGIGFRF